MKTRRTPPSVESLRVEEASERDIDHIVARSARRAELHEAIVGALADMNRFVRQPWHAESGLLRGSIRFDGRLMLVAASALARYDRLTNTRLHARLGFAMDPGLQLPDEVRARVQLARDACLSDLAQLASVSRSKDLPAARRALRLDGAEQTPEQSTKRQRHRDMATIVKANLERRVDAFRRELDGEGRALRGETMSAVYAIVATAFSGNGQTASADTVRRAWLTAKASSPSLDDLQDTFERLRTQVSASRPDSAPSQPPVARPRAAKGASTIKKSIDRALSKKR